MIFGNETSIDISKKVVIFPPSCDSLVLLDDLGTGIEIIENIRRFLDTGHTADFPNENRKRSVVPEGDTKDDVNRRCLRSVKQKHQACGQFRTPLHRQMTLSDTKQSM